MSKQREVMAQTLGAIEQFNIKKLTVGQHNTNEGQQLVNSVMILRKALKDLPENQNQDKIMIKQRDAMVQTLEAIEQFSAKELTFGQFYTNEWHDLMDCITVLREALKDLPENQE